VSLLLSILSRWLIQFCLYLVLTSRIPGISTSFLKISLLILSSKLEDIIPEIYRVMAGKRFGKRSIGISGKDVGG
jgi:hypothetical protein